MQPYLTTSWLVCGCVSSWYFADVELLLDTFCWSSFHGISDNPILLIFLNNFLYLEYQFIYLYISPNIPKKKLLDRFPSCFLLPSIYCHRNHLHKNNLPLVFFKNYFRFCCDFCDCTWLTGFIHSHNIFSYCFRFSVMDDKMGYRLISIHKS